MESNGIEESDYLCPVCAVDFLTLREFEEHKSTIEHLNKYLNKVYSTDRLSYLKDKFNIGIDVLTIGPGVKDKPGDFTIEVAAEVDCTEAEAQANGIQNGIENGTDASPTEDCCVSFSLILHNKGTESFHFIGINLLKTNNLTESGTNITINDPHQMAQRSKIIFFRPGNKYEVKCKIESGNNISRVLHIPILFEFQTIRRDKDQIEIQENVKIFYVGRTLEIKGKIYTVRNFGNFVPGVYPEAEFSYLNELEKELRLEQHKIPAWFQTLAYNNKPTDIYKGMGISPDVTFKNYKNFFRTLLWLEELQQELDIQFYARKEITLNFPRQDFNLGLKLVEYFDPGLSENRPCVMKRDKVFVCLSAEAKLTDKPKWYEGIVHKVKNQAICLGFNQQKFIPQFDGMTKFNLEFTINRHNFRVCHRAVDLCTDDRFRNILFPRKPNSAKKKYEDMTYIPDLELYNTNICNNYEQFQAIQQIVFGKQQSSPYVIFGPPGTGKTVTIVETIKQILYRLPSSYVLACAPSNSAADVIAERLLDNFTEQHVLRMYSESRTKFLKDLPERLLRASNYVKNEERVGFPPKDVLKRKRVIVCTFITAAKIASACFPDNHFTHVILDEAGHAMECEALVGVGGVLALKGKLVLAGDPHQLGPMIRNLQALANGKIFKKTGLDTSLLERIMKIPVYSKLDNNKYNPEYVTKLVKNYRSHRTILKVPNELFYNDELEAKGSDYLVNEYVGWKHLPKRGFPVIVHSVAGEDKTEAHSPSYHNPDEVREVVWYLKKLLIDTKPEDIGIITPYRLQVEKLRYELRRLDKTKIKVGSVEDFQGEEKKVIIISTVRASKRHLAKDDLFKLGFLRNPKRFNVAVTRAQCLLILVCCSDVLLLDKNWRRLIEYARSKGGYIGAPYRAPRDSMDDIIRRMGDLDIRPNVGDISKKQIVEVPSWERNT